MQGGPEGNAVGGGKVNYDQLSYFMTNSKMASEVNLSAGGSGGAL